MPSRRTNAHPDRDLLRADAGSEQDAAPFVVPAGQTTALSGTISSDVSFGSGGVVSVMAGVALSVFGHLEAPGSGAGVVAVAAGATLFAAGSVDPGIVLDLGGVGATLELAAQVLSSMNGAIAGFAAGSVIDIASGTITAATVGNGDLVLADDGVVTGALTLADQAAAGDWVLAVPDMIDGTRLLLAAPMPSVSGQAAPGTAAGAVFRWTGGMSGEWDSTSAWQMSGGAGALAPGAADTAIIGGSSNQALAVAGDGNAATLISSGVVALSGAFQIGMLEAGANSGVALALVAGATMQAQTATLAAGVLQIDGTGDSLAVTGSLFLEGGLAWVAAGGALTAKSMTLTGGTLRIDAAGAASLAGAPATAGTLTIGSSGTLSGFGALRAPVVNAGAILASGGVLAVFGTLSGTGTLSVAAGATLFAAFGIGAASTVAFQPVAAQPDAVGGTLELFGTASSCAAAIVGLMPADAIDIASATITQASWEPPVVGQGTIGILQLGTAGTLEVGLSPRFPVGSEVVQLRPDGFGGTLVQIVPCFAEETELAAPDGPIAAGAVTVGSRLLTRSGAARRVRWVGRRSCDTRALKSNPELRPVVVIAAAFGPGRPSRDLTLSPQHALLLATPCGPRLVPAVALVDGYRVRRASSARTVAYIHIELDSHDILLAEGLATESFLADGPIRRRVFGTASGRAAPANLPFAARVEHGLLLEIARHRAGARLASCPQPSAAHGGIDGVTAVGSDIQVHGWVRSATGGEAPMVVSLQLGNRLQRTVLANQWRPDLEHAGVADARLGFSAIIPRRALRTFDSLVVRATYGHAAAPAA